MRPIRLGSFLSGSRPTHFVVMKQPERVVEPVRIPLLPSESLESLGSHQVAPNLLLHPLADKRKALAGVPYCKVCTPSQMVTTTIPFPSWSRDGQSIYYGSMRSGSWQMWKQNVHGGGPVQITQHGGFTAFESYDVILMDPLVAVDGFAQVR